MIASSRSSLAASSGRSPLRKASIESRRIFACFWSTSCTATSSRSDGRCSAMYVCRKASSLPSALRRSIVAWRRSTPSRWIAASRKRSVSRRNESADFMAARRSLSSLCFRGDAMPGLSELALAPLGFLALATGGGTLVELAAAGLREDPGLLDLLVETAKGGLERLAITDDHFRQRSMDHPPFGP